MIYTNNNPLFGKITYSTMQKESSIQLSSPPEYEMTNGPLIYWVSVCYVQLFKRFFLFNSMKLLMNVPQVKNFI